MARRLLLVACVLGVTAFAARADEYATFILNNGERVSGTLVAPTNNNEALVSGTFNLAVSGGQPERVPYDQVAVIDFAGGSPRANELSALPSRDQMMAMRNGGIRMGHFINIVSGETIRWQETGGAIRDIPARQVARIYLNPDSARQVFNATSSNFDDNSGSSYASPRSQRYNQGYSTANTQVLVNDMVVPGNMPWSDTGVNVTRGDTFRFESQGDVSFIQGPTPAASAAGSPDIKNDKYPVRWLGVGALIGKVGVNGTPFAIGASTGLITIPASGRLFLGINDDEFNDNDGAFRVTISRAR